MSKITFSEQAWDEYLYWQSQDKRTTRKMNVLLKEIQRNPFSGEGKPEPLKGITRIHNLLKRRTGIEYQGTI